MSLFYYRKLIVYQDVSIAHLPSISNYQDIAGFNFSPDIIWIFDLDSHQFWWGNDNALKFWGLEKLQQLIDKDLSADTAGARKRTEQTFVKAAKEGITVDPWTTYPMGQLKKMLMRHKAILLGQEKHRGIIAFVSEQMDFDNNPANLLFAEAVRYTSVSVSSFSLDGQLLFENPTYTQWYGRKISSQDTVKCNEFVRRFKSQREGKARLKQAQDHQDGQQEHLMLTKLGIRKHIVDLRTSRHPITGDYITLVTEYDVTTLTDAITKLEKTKEELKKLAHYDPVTQLPTVRLCKEILHSALLNAKRCQNKVAVMFIDLDGFKAVNDEFGHATGDELLSQVAARFKKVLRESDTVGRIGGDEFIFCLPNIIDNKDAFAIAENALDKIDTFFTLGDGKESDQKVNISASIGISFYPDCSDTPENLIKLADERMYQAKKNGKNRFVFM